MLGKRYRLSYLPLFYEELHEKIMYVGTISFQTRAEISFYRIYVDSYIVYYVVIEDDPDDLIMEVRRFLYHGQNQDRLV